MVDEKATKVTVSIYPSQIEKVSKLQALFGIRKWSQALQRLIDIAELPTQPNSPAAEPAHKEKGNTQ